MELLTDPGIVMAALFLLFTMAVMCLDKELDKR